MESKFQRVWHRKPNSLELEILIDDYIREEILFRQALALELDIEDEIVRRRLTQKMKFIVEGNINIKSPLDSELQFYLQSHKEDFRKQTSYNLEQIYFDSTKRGLSANQDAQELLWRLQQATPSEAIILQDKGDQLNISIQFSNASVTQLQQSLGIKFVKRLKDIVVGKWQGPIPSGLGFHLVFVHQRIEGEVPQLNKIRNQVIQQWIIGKTKQSNEQFYQKLIKQYKITIEKE